MTLWDWILDGHRRENDVLRYSASDGLLERDIHWPPESVPKVNNKRGNNLKKP